MIRQQLWYTAAIMKIIRYETSDVKWAKTTGVNECSILHSAIMIINTGNQKK